MDKLNGLKLLTAVVDRGSYSGAANILGVSPSTISKAISRLEDSLNFHIFHRTTRKLTLTEPGRAYVEIARRLITELEECEQELSRANEEPKGRLRISLPISYGRLYVLPKIHKFRRKYPDITLELSFDDAYVDMVEQGIDVSVRSGTIEESNLIARQLSPMDFIVCAAPSYVAQYGVPKIDDYSNHPWIRFRFRQTGRLAPVFLPNGEGTLNLDPSKDIIVDDGEALSELCAQGCGLTQVPHFLARKWIHQGSLLPILPHHRMKGWGVWAIYAKREYLPAKIRVFVEFLQQCLAEIGEQAYSTWVEELEVAK